VLGHLQRADPFRCPKWFGFVCPAGWGVNPMGPTHILPTLADMQVPTVEARRPKQNSGARYCCRQKF
jgi:hypothetical protein